MDAHAESGNESDWKTVSSILVKAVGLNCVAAPCLLRVIWHNMLLVGICSWVTRRPQREVGKVVKMLKTMNSKKHMSSRCG